MKWKEDWGRAQRHFEDWWQQKGLVLWLTAPLQRPREDSPQPIPPEDPEDRWCDPEYRFRAAEYQLAQTYFAGDAFPFFDTQIGPGSLALFVGCEPGFARDTVWYKPCISDPERHPPIRFQPESAMFGVHRRMIQRGLEGAAGRFLVGMPDLIEHFDILSAMRGPHSFMLDLYDRPGWVKKACAELSEVYQQAFDAFRDLIKDDAGGNVDTFAIYGKGRTAKVQCDAAAMLSPEAFAEFVVPLLREQCSWLDYSLFHLDGTHCLQHLDHLLAIEGLNGIQWTPQSRDDLPRAGDPPWWGLYRRILQGGKSVQILEAQPHQVIPLLEALGPNGVYLSVRAESEAQAREIEQAVEAYR